jgi:HlyD family secretion protein
MTSTEKPVLRPIEQESRRAMRRLHLVGFSLVVLLFGGFGGWATTTHLAGAVIAPGTLVVETSVKKVQHPTGGVIGEILVKEGDLVEEGQVVVRLDDTIPRSTLGIVRSQLYELLARDARLRAERDDAPEIAFPAVLSNDPTDETVALSVASERKLFESRKFARDGQRAQLRERVAQSKEEIGGLSAQIEAKESEIGLIGEELAGVTELYKKNLVSISRYMQLQRDQARTKGEHGQFTAERARARAKISETELQIIQLDQDFRTDVMKDLREAQGKIAELKERVTAAEDQLKRIDIRAPRTGFVNQLSVHTVGGVIANGETLMQIVPRSDVLVVEAKVAPHDVDQLVPHAPVSIRVMAANQRTTPEITGELTNISADLTHDQQQPNQYYYLVRISLPERQLAKLSDIKLVPGMPAEAFIKTHDRTPMEYLLKPLREQVGRAFRER